MKIQYENASKILIILVILVISLITIGSIIEIINRGNDSEQYEVITAQIAYQMLNDTENYPNILFLDVRDEDSYNSVHIKEAYNIPVDELVNRYNEIDEYRDLPIIVYDQNGYYSTTACKILASRGFSEVYYMAGGLNAWIEESYPVSS